MIDKQDKNYINLLEEISLNAWPSYKIELYDGWLIRYSYNYTYRTNSVQQVGISRIPIDEKIAYCEKIYTDFHTPTIFKISPLLDPSFDQALEARDYAVRHRTETMIMEMKDFRGYQPDDVEYEFYGRNSGLPSNVSYDNGAIVQLGRQDHKRVGDSAVSSQRYDQPDPAPDRPFHVPGYTQGDHRGQD